VVRATSRLRVGRWHPFQDSAAIFFLLLVVAAALTGFGFLALPPVIRDLQSLNGELPTRLPALMANLSKIPFVQHVNSAAVITWIQGALSSMAASLLTSFKNWAGALVQIIAGFVLTLYFILEGDGAYRWFLSFVPVHSRHRLDLTLRRAAVRMQKWLVGQVSLMLILGLASTIVYLFLQVRYAYALGVLTGLLNVIPVLGAAVSLALALLAAAIDSWGRVLGVLVFFIVYIQIENYWLIPRIMKICLPSPSSSACSSAPLWKALSAPWSPFPPPSSSPCSSTNISSAKTRRSFHAALMRMPSSAAVRSLARVSCASGLNFSSWLVR